MRAIIVEDNALIAEDLAQALEAAGYDVAARLMGYGSALRWISDNPAPEACVLDLDLGGTLVGGNAPGEEGRRLLSVLIGRAVPTVLYTGVSRRDAKLNGLDAQAVHVSKSEPPSAVVAALRDMSEAAGS